MERAFFTNSLREMIGRHFRYSSSKLVVYVDDPVKVSPSPKITLLCFKANLRIRKFEVGPIPSDETGTSTFALLAEGWATSNRLVPRARWLFGSRLA